MKDVASYSVTASSELELSGAINRVRDWMNDLPETAKPVITIRCSVKDFAGEKENSKTADMFKKGEVKDGVVRKRQAKGRGKLAAVPPADNGAEPPQE